LQACHPSGSAHPQAASTDTLAYHLDSIKVWSEHVVMMEEDLDSTSYEVSYPVFKDEAYNSLIQPFIMQDQDSSFQDEASRFISSYDEYVEENIAVPTSAWFTKITVSILRNTPRFFTVKYAHTDYTGGAHGGYFSLFHHFDIQSKKEIKLENLISLENQKELAKIAEKIFRRNEGLATDSKLSDKYFFENNTFVLADNFALEKEGLLFHYNVYEIKSFADGITELRIPYQTIKHLFNEEGQGYLNSIR